MKQNLRSIISFYFLFVFLFVLQKPLFMLYHFKTYADEGLSTWFQVMWHGLPLDFSIAGYLTLIPVLLSIVFVWFPNRFEYKIYNGYVWFVSVLLSVIFICDIELYSYWGFRLDATPLLYLANPKDAAASVPLPAMILIPVGIALYASAMWYFLHKVFLVSSLRESASGLKIKIYHSLVLLLLLALLFIPIRGGFSVSTMNVGKVYFSKQLSLNHAAINPAFSLLSSVTRDNSFAEQYRYFDSHQADEIFSSLYTQTAAFTSCDSTRLIKQNPNILFIILESFTGKAVEATGGQAGVTPHLNKLAEEGILFSNFYANGARTDKGLVSILSGYPTQPTTSIMKYPSKTQSLPFISKSLATLGYDFEFLYGGDADFANMRSYFMSGGFDKIISDKDFPVSERLSKWGANDEVTFAKLLQLLSVQQNKPYMKAFLTLSSHEPFEVPFHKFDNVYLNSVAYTDSCLGHFIEEFKQTGDWDNTLIVLLPDHGFRYPDTIANYTPGRQHIPMVWTGGAVLKPGVIDTFGSQIDLAPTLLGQLGLPYSEFTYGRNMLDLNDPSHFGFYTFNEGFGLIDKDGYVVYDCAAGRIIEQAGTGIEKKEKQGKALLQKIYDDLSKR